MSRALAIALAALAFAPCSCALQLAGEKAEDKQTVAWCVVGLSRTFTDPKAHESLRTFLQDSGGAGIINKNSPDVFAYISLDDHVSYVVRDGVNNSKSDVEAALKVVGTVQSRFIDNPTEVVEETLSDHVDHLDECFSDGFWKLRHRMVGSVNQILHMQSCVDMIIEEEKQLHQQYDIVVLARPDIMYYPSDSPLMGAHFFDELRKGIVVHESDHVFVLPRAVAQRLASDGKKILSCSPGEKCCRKVQQSEDMFEFKLGFQVKYSGSCGCSTEHVPAVLKKSWDLYGESSIR